MVINLYNETNAFNAHTQLQSAPVTIDVDPVGISIPTGVIRLEYDKPITHIKFNYSGIDYICKITAVTNMGGTLNEYAYSIDYLKDYCNKYGLAGQDIVVSRSTNSELWRTDVVDNQFPRGSTLSYVQRHLTAVNSAVMLVVNYNDGIGEVRDDCDTYIIPLTEWSYIQNALLNPMTYDTEHSEIKTISPEFVTTAIRGAYIIPWNGNYSQTEYQHFILQNYITIYARGNDGQGNVRVIATQISTGGHPVYRLGGTNTPYGLVMPIDISTDVIRPVNDWRDVELYKYSMYAPFYGAFEINPQHFNGVYYHISPTAGMVTISTVLGDTAGMLNPQRLPEINYITDTTISAQRIINQQTAISTGAAAAQAALSIAVSAIGAATGNAMLTAGGVAGAVQSVGNAVINTQATRANQMYALSQPGLQYSAQTGTFGTRMNYIGITRVTVNQPLTMGEFASRYGYYCDYKIGDSIPESVQNRRCWLDLHGARLRGADWYASGARAALDGACIIID